MPGGKLYDERRDLSLKKEKRASELWLHLILLIYNIHGGGSVCVCVRAHANEDNQEGSRAQI